MHKTITSHSEIQLFLKPDCSKSKKALAYAHSISSRVSAITISKRKATATMWLGILQKLNKKPKDLLDKSLPYYQKNIRGRDFDPRDWTDLLMKNPSLLRSPIVIRGDRALILDNPTDIYKI